MLDALEFGLVAVEFEQSTLKDRVVQMVVVKLERWAVEAEYAEKRQEW